MKRNLARWIAAAAVFASATAFQGCLVVFDGYPVYLDVQGFPHFDGDGEDSLLDRWFGFDDDD